MSDDHDDLDLDLTQDDGTQPKLPDWIPGNYIVTCLNVLDGGKSTFPRKDPDTKEPMRDENGELLYPEQWKWVFRIDSVDAAEPTRKQRALVGKEVHQWTNKGLGERAHTSLYINALMGRKVTKAEKPRMSWVLGQQARATIDLKDSGAPKVTLSKLPPRDEEEEEEDGPPPDQVEQMAQQAYGDSRENIMEDLMYVKDRRDFAPIMKRIEALRLTEDDEVMDVYTLNHTRVAGGARQRERNTSKSAQPALVK